VRRDRVEIWTEILLAVRTSGGTPGFCAPSRIQSKVNLPYTRFWKHVMDLETHGLLESSPLRTTREGDRFLNRTRALREELERLRGAE
jgi:predicted transcriptional regulator